jgi:hypothetical protein
VNNDEDALIVRETAEYVLKTRPWDHDFGEFEPDDLKQLAQAYLDGADEVGRLRTALRRYGSHQRAYCGDPPINRCLCGLDATLAGRTVSSQPPETSSR